MLISKHCSINVLLSIISQYHHIVTAHTLLLDINPYLFFLCNVNVLMRITLFKISYCQIDLNCPFKRFGEGRLNTG